MELAIHAEASGPGLLETDRVHPPDTRSLDHGPHALALSNKPLVNLLSQVVLASSRLTPNSPFLG